MKQLLSLVLAILMVFSTAVVASAESTTTLTTTVPAASYTLSIPADQEITFGATETDIGLVQVTESAGFAKGKNLEVTFTYAPFSAEGISTTIPFSIEKRVSGFNDYYTIASGGSILFLGGEGGSVSKNSRMSCTGPSGTSHYDVTDFVVCINSEDWGKALGGDYSATITFTAEVVIAS